MVKEAEVGQESPQAMPPPRWGGGSGAGLALMTCSEESRQDGGLYSPI